MSYLSLHTDRVTDGGRHTMDPSERTCGDKRRRRRKRRRKRKRKRRRMC